MYVHVRVHVCLHISGLVHNLSAMGQINTILSVTQNSFLLCLAELYGV